MQVRGIKFEMNKVDQYEESYQDEASNRRKFEKKISQ